MSVIPCHGKPLSRPSGTTYWGPTSRPSTKVLRYFQTVPPGRIYRHVAAQNSTAYAASPLIGVGTAIDAKVAPTVGTKVAPTVGTKVAPTVGTTAGAMTGPIGTATGGRLRCWCCCSARQSLQGSSTRPPHLGQRTNLLRARCQGCVPLAMRSTVRQSRCRPAATAARNLPWANRRSASRNDPSVSRPISRQRE